MSNIINPFTEDLQLAGYAQRSRQSYASSVLRLQCFYNEPFEDITAEQLRQYWLCCHSEIGWSAASLHGNKIKNLCSSVLIRGPLIVHVYTGIHQGMCPVLEYLS
jgi:uncharacterized membrane protein